MTPIEMSGEQRRVFINAAQLYESFIPVSQKTISYRGGMHWKKVKGREYLFRTRDRYGYGKSLGLRSPETEKIIEEFQKKKIALKERLATLKESLKEQARFCKAARIQRVPRIVTGILRLLDQETILGKNVVIAGTNAIYAYEAAAGIFINSELIATNDMDILWDTRPKLTILLQKDTDCTGLIGILRKADRSFEPIAPGSFRAVNREGYMVDLIKPEPRSIRIMEQRQMGNSEDLSAAEIKNLQWLVASPKFYQTVIGDDGYPAMLVVPDPRAFALHKLWLSDQSDRDPIKKKRDYAQAIATLRLTIQYLPKYRFEASELRMFPKNIIKEAFDAITGNDLPVGFGDG